MADLVAAALSSILQSTVVTYDEYHREKEKKGWQSYTKLDVEQLFRLSYVSGGQFGDSTPVEYFGPTDGTIPLFVKFLNGRVSQFYMPANATVEQLKKAIGAKKSIPVDRQRLIFAGRQLENRKTLRDYGITRCATVHLVLSLTGGGPPLLYVLDDDQLDTRFDFDFTGMRDDGKTFTRGGYPYYRPYGWRRYALKVLGKYENDIWLGTGGLRVDSSPGEWPVSYHGTTIGNAGNIAQEGYDLSKRKRSLFGEGVYTSPSIETAAHYAGVFQFEGKNHRVVLQNRVSPDRLEIVNAEKTGAGVEFWVQPNEDAVRPYGICVQAF